MTTDLDARLRQAMRAAADAIEPPSGELVRGGLARGRRLRRRRVVGTSAGLAAAALVMVGVAVAPQIWSTPEAAVADHGLPDAGTDGEPAVTEPDHEPAATEPVELTSDLVIEHLVDLLPPGNVVEQWANGPPMEGMRAPVGGAVVYDDGAGAGLVGISIEVGDGATQCPHPSAAVRCEIRNLGDGSTLSLVQRPVFTDGRDPDRLVWSATVFRRDGLQVNVQTFNSAGEKEGTITRAKPPLTMEQLESIATAEHWFTVSDGSSAFDGQLAARELYTAELDAQNQALVSALGDGWTATDDSSQRPAVEPTAERAADLPDAYDVAVTWDLFTDLVAEDPEYIDRVCQGWTEKGFERDPCVRGPGGGDVHLQWSRSVPGEAGYSSDALTAIYVRDGDVVRVIMEGRGPEDATVGQRAAVVSWIEGRVDDLVRVATSL